MEAPRRNRGINPLLQLKADKISVSPFCGSLSHFLFLSLFALLATLRESISKILLILYIHVQFLVGGLRGDVLGRWKARWGAPIRN